MRKLKCYNKESWTEKTMKRASEKNSDIFPTKKLKQKLLKLRKVLRRISTSQ
jgi:hypothetical protein